MKRVTEALIAFGPLGLFLFAIADGAGVPSPGGLDAVLILLCANNPAAAYLLATVTLVGSITGCMILFYIARRGGEAYLAKYTASGRGARFKAWFQHYGLLTIFIPALIPIPMPLKVFVICAGALGIRPAAYLRVGGGVERLEQTYRPRAPSSEGQSFDYAAPQFEFACRLDYDRSGLVVEYPGIATREL